MSKKRLWDEVSDHTESNDVSVSYGGPDPPPQGPQPSQQGNKSKRARLAWSEKPLIRPRSSWGGLGAFCSKWLGFLFTINDYHRKPNVTAGKEIRLEIRHTASIPFTAYNVTTLKDEILIFGGVEEADFINVYDRTNLTEPKAVIPLEAIEAECIEACNVSNCVYVLVAEPEAHVIVRLTKDDRQFNISPPLIGNLLQSCSCMNVSANGNIIVSFPVEIAVYNSSGSLRHKVVLSANVYGFRKVNNVVQKSNGNLVVQSRRLPSDLQDMIELDTTGRIVHQHQSLTPSEIVHGSFVDAYDRTFVCFESRIDVLDPEFNALKSAVMRPDKDRQPGSFDTWHYDRERHEAIRLSTDENFQNDVLSIFHLGEQ